MKFIADEHIDAAAVEALKQIYINIVSVQELNMQGRSDETILTYARENNRVIVTADTDFLILNAKGMEHSGIVFITKPLSVGELRREIEKISLVFEPEHLQNRVIFIPLK